MTNKYLAFSFLSLLVIISGCAYGKGAPSDFMTYTKPGASISQVRADLFSCGNRENFSSFATEEAFYNSGVEAGFCMLKKGYTKSKGYQPSKWCQFYKEKQGIILPACTARGIY